MSIADKEYEKTIKLIEEIEEKGRVNLTLDRLLLQYFMERIEEHSESRVKEFFANKRAEIITRTRGFKFYLG